jgi:acetoin utilization deacetylase AcuC-like enzyme
MIKVSESKVKMGQHSDTSFSVGSLRAARRAAGAVQHAVDWYVFLPCILRLLFKLHPAHIISTFSVLVGRNRNAFCLVRPPGHHAGVNGLLDGGESCGFCIFNSVAAGAMHAISDEKLLCERCAIVDIDVHHGNGTEEIVRKYHDPGKLFFFSIHLYDNEEKKRKRESKSFQYKFYPGTGEEDDVALNIINVPINPLWKEKQANPAATHSTRTRSRNKKFQDTDGDSSENGTPKASDADTEVSKGSASTPSTPTTPNPNSNAGRFAYRRAIQNRLLPALRAFNPDLILISAGFDACKGDVGNAKHEFGSKEKMGIDLEPEDYAWTTRKVLEIADICCQGRVVSVLEGGYGRTPAAPPAGVDNSGTPLDGTPLDKSAFSECAMRHVHAMIDPYDVEVRFKSSRNDS